MGPGFAGRTRQCRCGVTFILIVVYYVSLYTCLQNYVQLQVTFSETGSMMSETIDEQPIKWQTTFTTGCDSAIPFFWAHQLVSCSHQQLVDRQPLSRTYPNISFVGYQLTTPSVASASIGQFWDGSRFIGGLYETQGPDALASSYGGECYITVEGAIESIDGFDDAKTSMIPPAGVGAWVQQLQGGGRPEQMQPLYLELLRQPSFIASATDCVNAPFFTHTVASQAISAVPLSFSPLLDCVGFPISTMASLQGSSNALFSSGHLFSLNLTTQSSSADVDVVGVTLTAASLPPSTCHSANGFPSFFLPGDQCVMQDSSVICKSYTVNLPFNVQGISGSSCDNSQGGYSCWSTLTYDLPLRQWPPLSSKALMILAQLRTTSASPFVSLHVYSPASYQNVGFYDYAGDYPTGCWMDAQQVLVRDYNITRGGWYGDTQVPIFNYNCAVDDGVFRCPTPLTRSYPPPDGHLDMTGYTCLNQSTPSPSLDCYSALDSTDCSLAGFDLELDSSISCAFTGSLQAQNSQLTCSFANNMAGVALLTALSIFQCTSSSTSISCPHPLQVLSGGPTTVYSTGQGVLAVCDSIATNSASIGEVIEFCFDSSLYFHQCLPRSSRLINLLPPMARLFIYIAVGKEVGKLLLFVFLSVFKNARKHTSIQYVAKNVGMVVYTCWHREVLSSLPDHHTSRGGVWGTATHRP